MSARIPARSSHTASGRRPHGSPRRRLWPTTLAEGLSGVRLCDRAEVEESGTNRGRRVDAGRHLLVISCSPGSGSGRIRTGISAKALMDSGPLGCGRKSPGLVAPTRRKSCPGAVAPMYQNAALGSVSCLLSASSVRRTE